MRTSIDRYWLMLAAGVLCVFVANAGWAQTSAQFEAARRRMVTEEIVGAGVRDERVIAAMLATKRHEFVPLVLRSKAYFDMALPIGDRQTISSPFIVAYMTESLTPRRTDRVLEIGTGSGYQAAVLSPLVKDVFSIEIVPDLGRKAERTLRRLNYDNVHVKVGDGYLGWPVHAPFDKIIVTCSPEEVPLPLVEQLAEGGMMVIPVGERYQQILYAFTKANGELVASALRPTLFVPMTGVAADQRLVQPDPARPAAVNGGFEEPVDESGHVPGWYYQRQVSLETDSKAPGGTSFVTFHNQDEGRGSRMLQGFPVDGRRVEAMEISAWIKCEDVVPGRERDMQPLVAISLYDKDRRDVGSYWLGPWRGSEPWHRVQKVIRIPTAAREGILRIGLFGATGEISFDEVRLSPVNP